MDEADLANRVDFCVFDSGVEGVFVTVAFFCVRVEAVDFHVFSCHFYRANRIGAFAKLLQAPQTRRCRVVVKVVGGEATRLGFWLEVPEVFVSLDHLSNHLLLHFLNRNLSYSQVKVLSVQSGPLPQDRFVPAPQHHQHADHYVHINEDP
jgi:hypothetical protein